MAWMRFRVEIEQADGTLRLPGFHHQVEPLTDNPHSQVGQQDSKQRGEEQPKPLSGSFDGSVRRDWSNDARYILHQTPTEPGPG